MTVSPRFLSSLLLKGVGLLLTQEFNLLPRWRDKVLVAVVRLYPYLCTQLGVSLLDSMYSE